MIQSFKRLCAFFAVVTLSLPAQAKKTAPPVWQRSTEKGLSSDYAAYRASRVSEVSYALEVSLSEQEQNFSGTVTIDFKLSETARPLAVDFNGGKIISVTLNGTETPVKYNSFFLELPEKLLKAGQNQARIVYEHPYSRAGSGLYRFQDPEDKKVYTYTDFEPYDANLLFPCFDQPDLKAKYTLKVNAPKEWTVVTYALESKVSDAANNLRTWEFPQSKAFSTYIFSLHAGPYHIWKGQSGNIPLRLMARESLSKFVDTDEWFQITDQGLKFFGSEFGFEYPFLKYDQIIVPDFNAGAMENVAAVTFSERFVRRGSSTLEEREDRANVILHEMAHMWFGNLVTMRWWNDLWLNESFASYMASLALVDATQYKNAWQSFFSGMKQWAYFEDQLVTTHPIVASAETTEHAFSNFDGITYGKGASVLKQLSFSLGRENFKKGVAQYFQKHAYGNATLNDFMGALSTASNTNLDDWSKEWLQTTGVNNVATEVECKEGQISAFRLKQTNLPLSTTLRSHKTQVGLFQLNEQGRLTQVDSEQVIFAGALTHVDVLKGKLCPDFAYVNAGDNDYVQLTLDTKSLTTAKKHLSKIDDDFTRMQAWQSLWDMVRNAQLPLNDYVELALAHLGSEKNPKILDAMLKTLGSRRSLSVAALLPQKTQREIKTRNEVLAKIENLVWTGVSGAEAGSDVQKFWFDAYIVIANSPEAQAKLNDMLQGKSVPEKLEIDQERRWDIVSQLSSLGFANTDTIIDSELAKDASSFGKQSALSARAAKPDLKNKNFWYAKLIDKKSELTLAEKRAIGSFMFPANQQNQRHNFAKKFYADVPKMAADRENEFLGRFARYLAPVDCTTAQNKQLDEFLKKKKNLPPVVTKALKGAKQEDERCIRIRRTL